MASESFHYRVCIIRSWQEHTADDAAPVWRFTLEIPATSQRRGFTSQQELLDALGQELQGADELSRDTDGACGCGA